MSNNATISDKDIADGAKAFAAKTLGNLKTGAATKQMLDNAGPVFTRERDAQAVENHKSVLNSPLWEEFCSEVQ